MLTVSDLSMCQTGADLTTAQAMADEPYREELAVPVTQPLTYRSSSRTTFSQHSQLRPFSQDTQNQQRPFSQNTVNQQRPFSQDTDGGRLIRFGTLRRLVVSFSAGSCLLKRKPMVTVRATWALYTNQEFGKGDTARSKCISRQ